MKRKENRELGTGEEKGQEAGFPVPTFCTVHHVKRVSYFEAAEGFELS